MDEMGAKSMKKMKSCSQQTSEKTSAVGAGPKKNVQESILK